mmetsp:Transcript_16553/g.18730  ORF Transcript_16553/g.18730 Transcript_16553/m.18730 type:complete len:436 (+) Transcript_16553:342-1649(+)|eukprot:CAMPEP_0184034656 /NCGR_PEP_ID=MMETSP0955-20130417/16770_1 /TAXON_ID=627963 /ORGANISM="Aplanochytrium sp, Strain PBS07" /LENGTH=435 /DNA_ID=CAMNT_0026321485 /DNA_START=263 /DNA_END=1570 /DNA_ORIENTATION=-
MAFSARTVLSARGNARRLASKGFRGRIVKNSLNSYSHQRRLLQGAVTRQYHKTVTTNAVPEFENDDILRGRERVAGTVLGEAVYDAKTKRKSKDNQIDPDLHKNYFVTAIKSNATIRQAVEFMVDRQVGSLMIVDEENKVKGIVTEHDIVFRLLNYDQDEDDRDLDAAQEQRIDSIATSNLVCAKMGGSLMMGFDIMNRHGFRHLPIVSDKVQSDNAGEHELCVSGVDTDISQFLHIISIKGLLARFYKDITGLGFAVFECEEDLERTKQFEEHLSSLHQFPLVKHILQEKVTRTGGRSTVLNTDTTDECTVADVIPEMKRLNGASLAVLSSAEIGEEEDPKLVGIVTERDILREVLHKGLNPEDVLVADIMTEGTPERPLRTVNSKTSLLTCIREMKLYDVRHLPVTNKAGDKIMAMLSAKDVVSAICNMKYSS